MLTVCLFVALQTLGIPAVNAHKSIDVLHGFGEGSGGDDPSNALVMDKKGNLYGTTLSGGKISTNCPEGCGVVFEIAPDGTETTLYVFKGGHDGSAPSSPLVMDTAGDLYGTTFYGGEFDAGTIFKVPRITAETDKVLHSFGGGADGAFPFAGLVRDGSGNIFGVTASGGNNNCAGGCGTIFRLAADNTEAIVYAFCSQPNCADGRYPDGLSMNAADNLVGTTLAGGSDCNGVGCGTAFKVAPDGTEEVLYAFHGGVDGAQPMDGVVTDASGNFYGITAGGGRGCGGDGCGTVFKLAPNGTKTTLYAFCPNQLTQNCESGSMPNGGVIVDGRGNVYGTTVYGGATAGSCRRGCGTIFKLTPDGREKVLYAFLNDGDGCYPESRLLLNHDHLFGTNSCTVFELAR
jgi:uncharacterized repeat protein (TIGR03803 family)